MHVTPPRVVKAPRRKPGRGSQVMPDERLAIQRAHLTEGLNQRQLADRFGRTRETIGHVLKEDGFTALKREVYAEMAEEARGALRAHVGKAAKDWLRASGIAAKRGDHRPAKEILLYAGAIDRLGETPGPQVTVMVGMPGHPAMIPPSQAEIEAARARDKARRVGVTIDVAAHPGRTIDVGAQPGRTIDVEVHPAGTIDVEARPGRTIDATPQSAVPRLEASSREPAIPSD